MTQKVDDLCSRGQWTKNEHVATFCTFAWGKPELKFTFAVQ
jgi:hypothetical protein